uniref:Uncharacterized protein n=1 Tax=Leersia perrieri TaxID=77586 RepID=A0A0D9V055_9ORYZ
MARSLAKALPLVLCLAAHLFTIACARHMPAEPEGFHLMVDSSPTYAGPSPACGHGNNQPCNQPSSADDVPLGGSPGFTTESGARDQFTSSLCRGCNNSVPVIGATQRVAGYGEEDRP